MKHKLSVEVPLNGNLDVIEIPPPCVYCGAPIAEGTKKWEWKHSYNLQKWGRGKKSGNMMLWDQTDGLGRAIQGNVIVQAYYCPEHTSKPKIVLPIQILQVVLPLAITILIWFGIYTLIIPIRDLELKGLLNIILFFGLNLIISYGIIIGLIKIISAICVRVSLFYGKDIKDYPLNTFGWGHWGLDFQYFIDQGEFGIGPIRYWLRLFFTNPESAQRFKEAYLRKNPVARIGISSTAATASTTSK